MEEKLIRDRMGSPVPQYFNTDLDMFAVQTVDGSTVTNGDVDFSKTKLLRDKLGSVIPQVWDTINHKWVVVTTQSNGGNSGGGEVGTITWDSIPDKPTEFTPTKHTHEIGEISGLQDELDSVFQQVSSGKSLLETAVLAKGSTVIKTGDVATFEELRSAILAIASDSGNTNGTTLESLAIDRLVAIGFDTNAVSDMTETIMYPNNFVADNVQIKLTEVR